MNIKAINIKGKDYVTVADRVKMVHETRETFEMVSSGPVQVGLMWVWQVIVRVNGTQYIGTAEIKFDAPKNTADGTNPIACAETSATGRALGFANLGTIESIASADEVIQAIAEQDVERKPSYDPTAPSTDQQIQTICKLQRELGYPVEPADYDGLTFGDAANMLKSLNMRLQSKRKAS